MSQPDAPYPPAKLVGLYQEMVRVREIEEAIAKRYSEQEMRCPVHLSIGQEGTAVGACAALRPADQIVTSHRCHGHYLAKGGDLKSMLAEIYGKASGCCGGRGGSMHLFDKTAGVLASVPIVGSYIPLGLGAALSFTQRGEDNVAVVFLGDGALEEGVFHESANLASLLSLPVVFFVENNLYSVYTPLAQRQPDRPLSDIAKAYAMPSHEIEGNDVLAVLEATTTAVKRARAGDGPSFIVAATYRWREHCGPNYDNDIGYRTEAEFQHWKARCPVRSFGGKLRGLGVLDDAREEEIRAGINAEIEAAFAFAKDAPLPEETSAGDGVYA